jgi:alpha-tubulin suppressor-like RCC1 family protein
MPVNLYLCAVLDGSGTHFYTCGSNEDGQLGTGDTEHRTEFTRVDLSRKFSSIAPGYKDFCVGIAEEDGSLWSWGSNAHGQLGMNVNEIVRVCSPTQISNTFNFTQISSGAEFCLALDSNNRVWSFGRNNCGQLGLGHTTFRDSPTMITSLKEILSVSCGMDHGLVLDVDGNLWSFGSNSSGKLGLADPDRSCYFYPRKLDWLPKNLPKVKTKRKTLFSHFSSEKKNVENPLKIIQISSGYNHNLVLDSQSRVWVWGDNSFGQLGIGNLVSKCSPEMLDHAGNISTVYCAGNSSIIQNINNQMFAFGNIFNTDSLRRPYLLRHWANKTIIPGASHTLIIDEDGNTSLEGFIRVPGFEHSPSGYVFHLNLSKPNFTKRAQQ